VLHIKFGGGRQFRLRNRQLLEIQPVIANAKKTTTVNKMNDRNKKPTTHSGTFTCPNTRATASQAKEDEFLLTL